MLLSRKVNYFAAAQSVRVAQQSTVSVAQGSDAKREGYYDPEFNTAKPLSEIPGPTIVQLITRFLPGGKYANKTLTDVQKEFQKEYGLITKLPAMFGRKPFVFIFDPSDIQKMYRTEGTWPSRSVLDTFIYYRKNYRQDLFGGMGGLLTEDGEPWQQMRTMVNPVMMQPRNIKKYVPIIDSVGLEFLENLRKHINQGEPPKDLFRELNKWALESIGYVALDAKLGTIQDAVKGDKLIDCVQSFFLLSFELEMKPSIWRYYATPKFNKLMNVLNEMSELIDVHIQAAIARNELKSTNPVDGDHELSVLEKLIKVDKHTAVVMAFDMLMAGIDTTATGATILLYNLAKNPEKQAKLREELKAVIPNKDSPITEAVLEKLPYLRACMKESHRVLPVVAGNARRAGFDIVYQGYQIPKMTDVIGGTIVSLHSDEQYPRSAEFLPERWLTNAAESGCPSAKTAHPFTYLPFGFGSRMCVGKRFAELEMAVLAARLIRNYELEWNLPDLQFTSRIINVPVGDISFKYTEVKE